MNNVTKVLIMIVIFLGGCSSYSSMTISDYVEKPMDDIKDYQVGVDDRLTVNVWRNTDLNITVPVRPDGKISVPLVGDVAAGGSTASEIAQKITKKLEKFIRDPQVTVIVSDLRSHEFLTRIRITGAVSNQLSIPYRQGMTVLDAVLLAGGINDFGDGNGTILFRKMSDKHIAIEILLDDILNQGGLKTNITLRPGDIISVPERIF